jgi:hypothetical protein
MEKVHYKELLKASKPVGRRVVNVKGANGSGKSTIPLQLQQSDPDSFIVVSDTFGPKQVVATVFPSYGWLALGEYRTQCGGCDAIGAGDDIQLSLRLAWLLDYDILFEGVIVADIRSTYHQLLVHLNNSERYADRRAIMLFPTTTVEECLRRIQARNGGKPINEQLVRDKHENNRKSREWYLAEGKLEVVDFDTTIPIGTILPAFLEAVK